MNKPESYEVHNPEDPVVESRAQRKKRLKIARALHKAAFAHTPEQTIVRQETMRRHATFDDARKKGGRKGQNTRAIRDSLDN